METYVVVGGDGIVFFDVNDAVNFAFRLPAGPAYGLTGAAGGGVVHGSGPTVPAPSVQNPRFLLGDDRLDEVLEAYHGILDVTAKHGIVLFQVQAVSNSDQVGKSTSPPMGCVGEAAKVKAAAVGVAAGTPKALCAAAGAGAAA